MTEKITRRAAINTAKNIIAKQVQEALAKSGMNAERCVDDCRVVKIPLRIRYEERNAFASETIELEVYIKEVQI